MPHPVGRDGPQRRLASLFPAPPARRSYGTRDGGIAVGTVFAGLNSLFLHCETVSDFSFETKTIGSESQSKTSEVDGQIEPYE
jgi:hypothetical protein